MVQATDLKVGGCYNWRNQKERLIYMGMCEPRNGRWYQFALVEKPEEVWCEVHPSDLHSIEETPFPDTDDPVTRQDIHDEIVRQTGQEFYSPPLHGRPDK